MSGTTKPGKDLSRTQRIPMKAHNTPASASVYDFNGRSLIRLICPSSLGASVTALTFEESWDDGTTWTQLVDSNGTAVSYVPVASKIIQIQPGGFARLRKLRLVVNHANGNNTIYQAIAAIV